MSDFPDAADPSARDVTWSQNGLHVRAVVTADGELRFEGHDLNPNPFGYDDYE